MLFKVQAAFHAHPGANACPGVHKDTNVYLDVDGLLSAFFCFIRRPDRRGTGFREGKAISNLMVNGQIREREVRLIDENGTQIGIIPTREAQQRADDAGLDLVCVSPKAVPPVCKIVDFGKYRYELARKEKEAKKKQKIIEIKEIRMSPNIDTNDLNTKISAARKFLSKGNKVKISIRFRGREMAHTADSKPMMDDFAAQLSDVAVIDKPAKMEGRFMTMFLSAKK